MLLVLFAFGLFLFVHKQKQRFEQCSFRKYSIWQHILYDCFFLPIQGSHSFSAEHIHSHLHMKTENISFYGTDHCETTVLTIKPLRCPIYMRYNCNVILRSDKNTGILHFQKAEVFSSLMQPLSKEKFHIFLLLVPGLAFFFSFVPWPAGIVGLMPVCISQQTVTGSSYRNPAATASTHTHIWLLREHE